ncbi:MAG: hypothetical protein WC490_05480 [Candidatus Margulisiibacteriota bacterium]
MKYIFSWRISLGLFLIILSLLGYLLHYAVFRDLHHIMIYLVGDIAFVFLEVLLVTLVLHELLHYREKKTMMRKLNMVIGAFFCEAGTELLRMFSSFDTHARQITKDLIVREAWSKKDFLKALKETSLHNFNIESGNDSLEQIKDFLKQRRQFLLNLLENPNLLEHEAFTDLLWAVFHLAEELLQRRSLKGISDADRAHLNGDIKRVYRLLIIQWLQYMEHLKENYPYLFSLEMRSNPFDESASAEIAQ